MNYDNLLAELALIEAANVAVETTLSKPPKVRAPLLANLLACAPCGVERRFEKVGGKLVCTGCGTSLDDERMRGPVPTPPFPPAAGSRSEAVAPVSAESQRSGISPTTAQHTNGEGFVPGPEPSSGFLRSIPGERAVAGSARGTQAGPTKRSSSAVSANRDRAATAGERSAWSTLDASQGSCRGEAQREAAPSVGSELAESSASGPLTSCAPVAASAEPPSSADGATRPDARVFRYGDPW